MLVQVPRNPISISVGDFSGDGQADVAVLNRSQNGASSTTLTTSLLSVVVNRGGGELGPVHLGAADGTLKGFTNTSVTSDPAVADLNGDGFPDLAVATNLGFSNVDEVQIWLGDATGSYSSEPTVRVSTVVGAAGTALATAPVGVAAIDVDGDEHLDLVVADAPLGVRFFLNDGAATPTFSTDDASCLLPIANTFQVFTAQLDSDPPLEIVARSTSSPQVNVIQGAYPFTMAGSVSSTSVPGLTDLATGYINSDDSLDLAGSLGSGMVVLLNDGTGGFLTPSTYLAPGGPPANVGSSVAVGDLDGNGLDDVVVAQTNAAQVYIFYALGAPLNGLFDLTTILTDELERPAGLAVGDVNGDGLKDLAVGGNLSSNVGLYLGRGGRVLESIGSLLSGVVTRVKLADLNRDGLDDILTGSTAGGRGLYPVLQETSP
jgi:hypothetical protein